MKRSFVAAAVILLIAPAIFADRRPTNLRGLRGCVVAVSFSPGNEGAGGLFSESGIQLEVETMLRQAGLKVAGKEHEREPTAPVLLLDLIVYTRAESLFFSMTMQLREQGEVARGLDSIPAYVITWSRNSTGLMSLSERREVNEQVRGYVRQFIADWKATNQ